MRSPLRSCNVLKVIRWVTDQAGAGEIVCTNVVRELVAGKSYLFSEREPAALKGVEEAAAPSLLSKPSEPEELCEHEPSSFLQEEWCSWKS